MALTFCSTHSSLLETYNVYPDKCVPQNKLEKNSKASKTSLAHLSRKIWPYICFRLVVILLKNRNCRYHSVPGPAGIGGIGIHGTCGGVPLQPGYKEVNISSSSAITKQGIIKAQAEISRHKPINKLLPTILVFDWLTMSVT